MKILLLLVLGVSVSTALILDPIKAMQSTFTTQTVHKKSLILTKKQHLLVQQTAQAKLVSKLYRVYYATKGTTIIGVGILLTAKVRSKSTVVLSMFTPKGETQGVEIIAFNEPKEYLPSNRYTKQFKHSSQSMFILGDTIPNISGATLSARSLVNLANLSQAIMKKVLHNK